MAKNHSSNRNTGQTGDAIPTVAVFTFRGKRQPPAFSRGVEEAIKMLRAFETMSSDCPSRVGVEELHRRLRDFASRGDAFGDGALVTVSEFLWDMFQVGLPNLDVWRPLDLEYGGEDGEIPPEECRFFDVEGIPYSVEPNLNTLEWRDTNSLSSQPVDSIRGKARSISRAQFEMLRWKVGAATREAEHTKQEAA